MADAAPVLGSDGSLDINSLLSGFANFTNGLNQAGTQIANILGVGQQANAETKSGINQEAAGKIQINNVTGAAKSTEQAKNLDAATAVGMNPDAASYMFMSTANEVKRREDELVGLKDEIAKQQSVSIFDDPMQWITNQITLPGKIRAANTKVGEINDWEDRISVAQKMLSSAALSNAIIYEPAALQIASAKNQEVAGAALQAKGAADDKLATISTALTSLGMAQTKDQWDGIVSLNHSILDFQQHGLNILYKNFQEANQTSHLALEAESIQNLKDSRDVNQYNASQRLLLAQRGQELHEQSMAALEDQRAASKLQMEVNENLKSLQAQALVDNKEAQTSLVDHANAARVLLNKPKLGSYLEYKNLSGNERKLLDDMITSGSTDLGAVATNPADANDVLDRSNTHLPGGQGQVQDKLRAWTNGAMQKNEEDIAAQKLGAAPWHTYGKDIQRAKINQFINDQAATELRSTPQVGSIYSPPSIGALLKTNPLLTQMSIMKDSGLAVLAKDPQMPLDSDIVMKAAFTAIQKGASMRDMADQIAAIYQAAATKNAETHNYVKLALPSQLERGFNQEVQSGFGNKSEIVDLSNSTKVLNFLTRSIVARKQSTDLANAPYSTGLGLVP